MGNLIKPSDYAKKMGISRQAVYAKIKRGILTSKSVDGKLYVVQGRAPDSAKSQTDNPPSQGVNPQTRTQNTQASRSARDLLAAKDETIAVLKETIVDLKETNQMITSTLRSEVDLLKEAFSEMKLIYSTQIEHLRIDEQPSTEESRELDADVLFTAEGDEAALFAEQDVAGDALAWIDLSDFFDEQGLRKKAKQHKVTKRIKKLFKKGDSRVDSFNGELIVLADADFSDILKKKNKK